VPQWMLDRAPSEQRVVLAHEAEHIRARDALVLGGASAAVVMMPWNPALWYMLSRVRLAVELDCDARVLRSGVAPKTYGTLLIDLAEQALPLRLTAVALADDLSHLHQRIVAMKPHTPRFALLRGGAAAALGLVGLLAACEAKLPTESDIKKMDASSAESAARQLALVNATDSVRYVIDSVVSSELAAKSLPAERIASVSVSKPGGGVSTISIRTKAPDGEPSRLELKRKSDSTEVNGRSLILRGQASGTSPIFFIDGVRTDQTTFAKLNRDDIQAVEVVKGKAAAEQYGPDAEHGVIVVTTKKKGE
jgi:bla regulator protein blaR1